MARRDRSFSDSGTWTRPRNDGRGRTQRELQNRASFDQHEPEGCGGIFLILALLALAVLGGLLA
jgi:hypothetical protein